MKECKVISNEQLAVECYLLTLERKIDFVPGQIVSLKVKNLLPRLYSIASGVKDDFIQILYTVKVDGHLTPTLSQLKSGDELFCSEARGSFLSLKKPSWWIATGTGIAPFVSMSRSGDQSTSYVKGLLHGSRIDFHFNSDHFSASFGSSYRRYVSGSGRVTDFIKERESFDQDDLFYLCGNAEMVVEARDLLIMKGVPFSQIKSEIYF